MTPKTHMLPDHTVVKEPPATAVRPTFGSLLREGISSALGVNSRWLRTLRGLLVNAGGTVLSYVLGVRDRYSHPLAYALGAVTAYTVVKQTLVTGFFERMTDAAILLGAAWPYVAIPLLIPAAFAMRWLYRGRFTAAECYVLALYVGAQIALVETVLVIALWAGAPGWLRWPVFALEAIYAMTAIVQFTGERSWHGWARALLAVGAGVLPVYGLMWLLVWYVWTGLFG